MKKVFICCGELSGDKIAAWYVRILKKSNPDTYFEAIGGEFLQKEGAALYHHIKNLSIVGIVEIIKHLPFLLRLLKTVSSYIVKNGFEEVVVVDFPGFNLKLASKLKRLSPGLKITYLSPPQLWVWGAWRVRKIKRYCDRVIVIYPFEVDWYAKRGISAQFLGYPFYEELEPFFGSLEEKEFKVALLVGSRNQEVKSMGVFFADLARELKRRSPDLKLVVPIARSVDKALLKEKFEGITDVNFVEGESEKFSSLSRCVVAISKPGTVTLELALLGVPTVVVFKTNPVTFFLGKQLVKVRYMGLANLLLQKSLFPEFIQSDCTAPKVAVVVEEILERFEKQPLAYEKRFEGMLKLRSLLKS